MNLPIYLYLEPTHILHVKYIENMKTCLRSLSDLQVYDSPSYPCLRHVSQFYARSLEVWFYTFLFPQSTWLRVMQICGA